MCRASRLNQNRVIQFTINFITFSCNLLSMNVPFHHAPLRKNQLSYMRNCTCALFPLYYSWPSRKNHRKHGPFLHEPLHKHQPSHNSLYMNALLILKVRRLLYMYAPSYREQYPLFAPLQNFPCSKLQIRLSTFSYYQY